MNRSRSSSAWLVIARSPGGDGRRRLGLLGGLAAARLTAARCEDALDDVLDRWVLDREVGDRQVAQDPAGDLGRLGARDAECYPAVLGREDLAIPRQVDRALLEGHSDRLRRVEAGPQSRQLAVVEDVAVMDDDDPSAKRLDVGHVVARQEGRRAASLGFSPRQLAETRLHPPPWPHLR